MALNLNELDTKSSDDLKALRTHYAQVRSISSRYDLKRCEDALRLIRLALRRRQQRITSEPESAGKAVVGASPVFDPLSLAIFQAMTPEPDGARKVVIDTLVKTLVSAGVWNALDAFYVFAAHSRAPALINWKNPGTFNAAEINGLITFTTDRGFTPNGATSYVDSGFNPSTAPSPNFVQDSAHIGAWVLTSRAGADKVVMGQSNSGNNVYPMFTDDKFYPRVNDNSEAEGFTVAGSSGLFVANRSSSTARQGYRNAASIGTFASNTSKAVVSEAFRVGAGGNKFSDDQLALATIGGSLDAAAQTALYNAALVYMQAVGAVP